LEPAFFVVDGEERAAELERDGNIVVVDLHGIFPDGVEFEAPFGGQHFQRLRIALRLLPLDADEVIDGFLGGGNGGRRTRRR
jgi:hypothetical protein